MNGRITILVGISNSGKSTYAHDLWSADPMNTVIVNRDNIRKTLFGYNDSTLYQYYERVDMYKLEKMISKTQNDMIYENLILGKHVIVDNTHLKRKYLEEFRYWNVPIQIILANNKLEVCLERNSLRERKLSEDVIKRQHARMLTLMNQLEQKPLTFKVKPLYIPNLELPKAIIVDIDGTVAEKGNRNPFDWKSVKNDLPIKPVIDIVSDLAFTHRVVVLSGRDGAALSDTSQWCLDNNILYDELILRQEGDNRPDWVFKEEQWDKLSLKYNIVGMFDDRQQVVRRARMLGYKVFNVEYNTF